MLRSVLALLAVCAAVTLAKSCHSTITSSSYGAPNLYPLSDGAENLELVSVVPNGKLYNLTVPNSGGNTTQTIPVVHLWGTPYEWGFAQGSLLKAETNTFIESAWAYMESQISSALPPSFPEWLDKLISDMGLEAALDLTYELSKDYTSPYIYEEMQGLADASGVSYVRIRNVHMIAGLTEGACSMFGAWGDALPASSSTKLLQLRALDWDMDGPFRNHNQLTVYHPLNETYGNAHVLVTFTGFIGALTGMSSEQLGISEIGVTYPDSTFGTESRIGIPFIFLLRDILQFDASLDDAINRMINGQRTCNLILGVGDGELSMFRGFEYSYSVLYVIDDQNLRPVNATWHPPIDNVVYWGMDWLCPEDNQVLSEQIEANYGQLSAAVAARDVSAVEQSGDNHIAFYDLTNMIMTVAWSCPYWVGGSPNAYDRQYSVFNVTALFAETY